MQRNKIHDDVDRYENVHGIIRFFNPVRKFGLIDSNESEHIFFISGFRNRITQDEISKSIGKNVTFSLKEDEKIEKRLIAVDIIFK